LEQQQISGQNKCKSQARIKRGENWGKLFLMKSIDCDGDNTVELHEDP